MVHRGLAALALGLVLAAPARADTASVVAHLEGEKAECDFLLGLCRGGAVRPLRAPPSRLGARRADRGGAHRELSQRYGPGGGARGARARGGRLRAGLRTGATRRSRPRSATWRAWSPGPRSTGCLPSTWPSCAASRHDPRPPRRRPSARCSRTCCAAGPRGATAAARAGLTVETFETAGGLVTRNVVYWSAEEVAARFRPI